MTKWDSYGWTAVSGWPGYEVHPDGQVRNRHGEILKPIVHRTGYLYHELSRLGITRRVRVHKIVTAAFLGPRPAGMVTLHLNSDPADNRIENLEYGTQSRNVSQSVAEGTHANARKTHCPRNHEYVDRQDAGKTTRRCRECHREQERERYRKARSGAAT